MTEDIIDNGLAFDLETMLDRRRMLRAVGLGLAATGLAACGKSSSEASAPTAGSTAATAGTSASTVAASSLTEIPDETAGPYPGDGSNGPDVLEQTGVVRQDIRSSFGDASGVADGVEMTLRLTILDLAAGGSGMVGAAVYAWHCTADGRYSMYSDGVTEENFLRGVQIADENGVVSFTSIFPGCYAGRWPHIHFEVFQDLDGATSASRPIVTSQIALPEGASREAYLTDGYDNSLSNLQSSSIDRDMVFGDGYESQLATVDGDPTSGYTAILVVGV